MTSFQRRRKKRSVSVLTRRLDLEFSKFIRERDRHCIRCGRSGRLECSHIVSRTVRLLRWDPKNAKALCHTCHRWWHAHPIESAQWIRKHYGDEHIDYLLRLKNESFRVSVPWLEDLLIKGW